MSRLGGAFCYSFGQSLEGRFDMALDAELLEILACPNCKTPVVLVHNGTGLKCNTCHRVYPIKDDIPVMLIDEATIEK
ncbi:MAG TPA: Trm112 family protein [Vicinamibacterales bacterium]|nr:Trm112 family protein [Vicinamibacterales bacterium]